MVLHPDSRYPLFFVRQSRMPDEVLTDRSDENVTRYGYTDTCIPLAPGTWYARDKSDPG